MWLEERQSSLLEGVDFGRVPVDTNDLMADFRKTKAGYQPDVSGSDDGEVHIT